MEILPGLEARLAKRGYVVAVLGRGKAVTPCDRWPTDAGA